MEKPIENRKEILFLYDAVYCNPNGDPSNENKPRVDPDTSINIVTDVRMKRTIRDFLHQIEEHEIFVRTTYDDDNYVKDGKARAQDFLETDPSKTFNEQKDQINQRLLDECIDVRLFGAVVPLEIEVENGKKTKSVTGSITHTGPVQFKMGRSLNKVSVERIKGTGAFAATVKKSQQSFRVEYMVPYSMISFYGIVNEYRAKETQMSEEDAELLFRGMWAGTKHLLTRSKSGLTPRLLIIIDYKQGNYQISDVDRLVRLQSDKDDLQLRSTSDFVILFDDLVETLLRYSDRIDRIRYVADDNLQAGLEGGIFRGSDGVAEILAKTGITTEPLDMY